MSAFETTTRSQEMTPSARSAMCCRLPTELLIEVMMHLPDLTTLSRVFAAYPEKVSDLKEDTSNKIATIVKGILNNMPNELRSACLDILAVRNRPPSHPSQVTQFLKQSLNPEVHDARLRRSEYSVSVLLDLIAVSDSIGSLTESFVDDRVLRPCEQHKMPLSPVELYRIQRSFWRFQLCYDMCHPEKVGRSPENYDAKSRSTRRYVKHQISCQIGASVPNWLQCRGERHRPEALSRFLPNLCRWELDELEAIRFHLIHEVNNLQYFRSRDSEDDLAQKPLLLQRLIRDIDHWDEDNPEDHVLVAALRQTQYAKSYPIVWERHRDLFAASSANTTSRPFMLAWQEGQPQWGWCLWDERRLVKRGMIDFEFENWLNQWRMDNVRLTARIHERQLLIESAHKECFRSQFKDLDLRIAAQFDIDARIHMDRISWDTIWELGPKEREWMPTELDCIYNR